MARDRWTIYVCPVHGPLSRAATHPGMHDPDALMCSYCTVDEEDKLAQVYVEEVEVVRKTTHLQALARAEKLRQRSLSGEGETE